jgi:hypothetical protein
MRHARILDAAPGRRDFVKLGILSREKSRFATLATRLLILAGVYSKACKDTGKQFYL